jgi:hypothetical protein
MLTSFFHEKIYKHKSILKGLWWLVYYTSDYWVNGFCLTADIQKRTYFRDMIYACSQVRGYEGTYQVEFKRSAILYHWTHSWSCWTQLTTCPPPFYLRAVPKTLYSFSNTRWWTQSINLILLTAIESLLCQPVFFLIFPDHDDGNIFFLNYQSLTV